jgi:hypothetical protein
MTADRVAKQLGFLLEPLISRGFLQRDANFRSGRCDEPTPGRPCGVAEGLEKMPRVPRLSCSAAMGRGEEGEGQNDAPEFQALFAARGREHGPDTASLI